MRYETSLLPVEEEPQGCDVIALRHGNFSENRHEQIAVGGA
ncbi:hypothetical protein ACWD25_58315 [Streptomyces sp. NPDC002920]